MLILKYTDNWIANFEKLKRELEIALHGLHCKIEHIGSTAVPGLDSKDIIDIDIVYGHDAAFDNIKQALLAVGYYHNGNQGIAQREVFKRTGKRMKAVLDEVSHHLYVCPLNSKEFERHILFRNYLRKNEWARLEYQKTKYELAEKAFQDKKVYAALKELEANNFIDAVIEQEKKLGDQNYGAPLAVFM